MKNKQTEIIKAQALAIAETIRELKTVPSGHLYARLMGYFSLEQYEQIIDILVRAKLIRQTNHLLTWIG